MMDLSVKQIEGLGENLSFAGCYITVEGDLIDVITPLTQNSLECSVRIPVSGKLHLIIKNMREGDKMIGSVSLPISILTGPEHWLPLFDNLEFDSLQHLPEKVDLPRVLISLSPQVFEHSLVFVDKIKSLQLKIMDLEHTLASERWEFQREIGSLSSSQRYREDSQALVIEQLKTQIEKQEILIQDLMTQKNDAKFSMEKDGLWKNDLEEKYKNLCGEFEQALKKSQDRDCEYLQSISNLKIENLEIKQKLDAILSENFEKELNISHLNEKINQLSLENYEALISNLKEKAKLFQSQLKESESQRSIMQQRLQTVIEKISSLNFCLSCESLQNKTSQLTSQICALQISLKDQEKVLQDLKKHASETDSIPEFSYLDSDLSSKVMQLMLENKYLKNQLSVLESRDSEFDRIDEALKLYPEAFHKTSPGQYSYNGVKVNIYLENNALMCRIGNACPINEFILGFNHASNSADNSFKENTKTIAEINSEHGENSFVSEDEKREESKKKDYKRQAAIKKQFRPDKKVFAPLRQSSAHMERKKVSK